MDTIRVKAVNNGYRGQILRQYGGTVEVEAGKTLENVEILPLSEDQIEHYRERGVTFSDPEAANDEEAGFPALESAVWDAEAAVTAAEKAAGAADAGDAERAALTNAQNALAAAERALTAGRNGAN